MKNLLLIALFSLSLFAGRFDFYSGLTMHSGADSWKGFGSEGSIDNPIGVFGIEYVNKSGDKSFRCEHLSSVPNVGEENWGFNHCGMIFYLNGDSNDQRRNTR